MTRVTITGWRVGLKKISLNHLIRQYTGCGLAMAKQAVDDLFDGRILTYDLPDRDSALDFSRSAEAIGAVCSISEESTMADRAPVTTPS